MLRLYKLASVANQVVKTFVSNLLEVLFTVNLRISREHARITNDSEEKAQILQNERKTTQLKVQA